jgi:hypothetical protein
MGIAELGHQIWKWFFSNISNNIFYIFGIMYVYSNQTYYGQISDLIVDGSYNQATAIGVLFIAGNILYMMMWYYAYSIYNNISNFKKDEMIK